MSEWLELALRTGGGDEETLVLSDERATVGAISDSLGVTDARILYHLRKLAAVGVISLDEEGEDRRAWSCSPSVGRLRARLRTPESSDVIPGDVAGEFNQASREVAEGLYGAGYQVSFNHNRARLSDAQAAEFSHRLLELIEDYFSPGKGDESGVKYGFLGVLTPIDIHPLPDPDSERLGQ
jgi:DNA-binding transcriptional ArsR family regulator